MNHLDIYYKMLGLEPGASIEEINQAYKDLAFIWHPDRIPKDNDRLLKKAVAKLQEINHAREQLRTVSKDGKYKSQTSSTPKSEANNTATQTKQAYYQAQKPYYKDLSGADLRGANLKEKDLSSRNMTNADLSHADLTDSFMHKVNLENANLYKANLFRANLLQANLRKANLQFAFLIGADLSGADLRGADLRGAVISKGDRIMVKLIGANLCGTIFPDGTTHR